MHGGLGDEAVGHGNADYAGYESCAAQEEKVPVESGGFLEGKLAGLG